MGDLKLLSEDKGKEAIELKKDYKNVYFCRKCGLVFFGSDLLVENGECPICLKKDNLKKKVEK